MNNIKFSQFSWVFIYVSAFGINDLLVKKFIKTDSMCFFYFICVGIIGLYLLFNNSKQLNSKNDKNI